MNTFSVFGGRGFDMENGPRRNCASNADFIIHHRSGWTARHQISAAHRHRTNVRLRSHRQHVFRSRMSRTAHRKVAFADLVRMVAVLLVAVQFCSSRALAAERYALLVGVSRYDGLPLSYQLKGPANDVDLLAGILPGLGFPSTNIRILAEPPVGSDRPTRAAILRELDRLAQIGGLCLYPLLRSWIPATGVGSAARRGQSDGSGYLPGGGCGQLGRQNSSCGRGTYQPRGRRGYTQNSGTGRICLGRFKLLSFRCHGACTPRNRRQRT